MIPWRRAWQPTPAFLPGESHGQRSLEGYSPWGCKRVRLDWATKHHDLKEVDCSILLEIFTSLGFWNISLLLFLQPHLVYLSAYFFLSSFSYFNLQILDLFISLLDILMIPKFVAPELQTSVFRSPRNISTCMSNKWIKIEPLSSLLPALVFLSQFQWLKVFDFPEFIHWIPNP